ncbi:exopolysaccharide biosynthesis GT4 family glycosyltransferase EpsE [Microbacterium sp. zg.Y909]|uniref:exopolysaccharide biosynthesis GT4 family glycosyltransferase EpsE n=1 Tax=Microbacterium sp. zg.Y909 TaxID=2969413 RepID=UPI00214B7A45|nr:exopolysaccharide biosynthesis GT4 family glycosyltransferase EpsE [Microbacterium sp. zg.Y909]MCR2823914.1 glycosyltransferase family 4 protein [Microbacterium sp. zg.Y909]
MDVKLGYLVPEFPGQTHAFFWREVQELELAGAEVTLLSTRPPVSAIASHAWGTEARARTAYLAAPGLSECLSALALLSRSVLSSRFSAALRALAPPPRSPVATVRTIAAAAVLAAHARRGGWSHVHVHSCAGSADVALAARLLFSLTYSLTLHGPLSDYGPRQVEKWSHAAFGLIITETLTLATRETLGSALPERLAVAPMGVRVSDMQRGRMYTPWAGEGTFEIFSCGRLNPAKGHDALITAIKRLHEMKIPARLVIAGEDEQGGNGYRRGLEALITQLDLDDHVELLGAVDEATVRDRLTRAHVFALASHGEPLGVAIMEAMAMSVPVVVGDGGGVRELVAEGTGLLVHPDVQALANALHALARDPQSAAALSVAGRAHVIGRFDSRNGANTLLQHVRLTLSDPTDSTP